MVDGVVAQRFFERERVRAHIRGAERFARGQRRGLDPVRALNRAILLDELARYRRSGRFPQTESSEASSYRTSWTRMARAARSRICSTSAAKLNSFNRSRAATTTRGCGSWPPAPSLRLGSELQVSLWVIVIKRSRRWIQNGAFRRARSPAAAARLPSSRSVRRPSRAWQCSPRFSSIAAAVGKKSDRGFDVVCADGQSPRDDGCTPT